MPRPGPNAAGRPSDDAGMADKDVLGRAGEERAARYYESLGFAVLARNWRAPGGELDLVVVSARELVVVEVKTRRSEAFGHPFEAVGEVKKARLWRLAMAWIAAHPASAQGRRLRIDAIGLIGPDPATASLEHLAGIV
jgi:putative endonuclease